MSGSGKREGSWPGTSEAISAVVGTPEFLDLDGSTPDDDDAVVRCHGVVKWFGEHPALDGFDLRVERGEVVVIIGRSGSGKSTLLRCIDRLERPDAGTISVLGCHDPDDELETRWLRSRTGMVFQSFNLFPTLRVAQNVTVALRLVHGWDAGRAAARSEEVLDRVGMARHADKWPDQLSGGEQQRVAIARALAPRPELMLLDEPTASIDPELTRGLLDLVGEIAEETTVVIVTHEMAFARASADRIVFCERGRAHETGPPDQILLDPERDETAAFVREARLVR